MTQEDKNLLFKDLCARLPYGVNVEYDNNACEVLSIDKYNEELNIWKSPGYSPIVKLEDCKPYLFPLSSMTEEQKKEISKRYNFHNLYGSCIEITNHSEGYWDTDTSCDLRDYLWLIDYFYKNHIDFRGFIELGLAKNATGLNIY